MSEYIGIAPPDPTTKVGQFRFSTGDISYTETDPPQPGFGNYAYWSDAQIEGLLNTSGGSVALAISKAYALLAAIETASTSGRDIATDDLKIGASKKAANWLSLSAYWRGVHEDESASSGADGFSVIGVRQSRYVHPEAAAWPVNCDWSW